jgi:molybdopterin converting factor small subunit
MSVRVNIFYPQVQQCIHNRNEVKVGGSTVGECLSDLIRQFPDAEKWLFDKRGQLLEHVYVYINAESARKADLSEPVKEKDELIIAVLITDG